MNTLTTLCSGLVKAVSKDEAPEVGGFDLSAGMFGPNVSQWLRDTAKAIDAATPVAPAPEPSNGWPDTDAERAAPVAPAITHASDLAYTKALIAQVSDLSSKLAVYRQAAPATSTVNRSLLESAIYAIQQSDTSSGYCMCGDAMATHDSGMHSGHAPCDSGDYHAQGVLQELRKALT